MERSRIKRSPKLAAKLRRLRNSHICDSNSPLVVVMSLHGMECVVIAYCWLLSSPAVAAKIPCQKTCRTMCRGIDWWTLFYWRYFFFFLLRFDYSSSFAFIYTPLKRYMSRSRADLKPGWLLSSANGRCSSTCTDSTDGTGLRVWPSVRKVPTYSSSPMVEGNFNFVQYNALHITG